MLKALRASGTAIFIVSIFGLSHTAAAQAKCPLQNLPEEFQNSTVVFRGKVVGVARQGGGPIFANRVWSSFIVEFKVDEPFKGAFVRKTVKVGLVGDLVSKHPPKATPGREWLVFANGSEEHSYGADNLCGHTRPIQDSGKDLQELRRIAKATKGEAPSRAVKSD